jgi:hypothetical protein
MALTQHLLTTDYQQLPLQEAKNRLENIKNTLKSLLQDHKDTLTAAEQTFFKRSLQLHHRIPLFYGIPKVHKTPTTLCPVVSTINSLLSVFSTWLDYQMKKLLPFIKSYLKNSKEVIEDLKNIHIPPNALLFSADATAMYNNIDSDTGLNCYKQIRTISQQTSQRNSSSKYWKSLSKMTSSSLGQHTGSNSMVQPWGHPQPVPTPP